MLVLEQQLMVVRRCAERVQLVWPLPLPHGRSTLKRSPAARPAALDSSIPGRTTFGGIRHPGGR
jgi:hypothetical protein